MASSPDCVRLDPDGKWLHIDSLDTEPGSVDLAGLPASLADALQDWLGSTGTSDEDVAQFVGWSVEEVARHREEVCREQALRGAPGFMPA